MSRLPIVTAISSLCIGFLSAGCSLIGLTAGFITDVTTSDYDTLRAAGIAELDEGDSIGVSLKDGTEISGLFLGTDPAQTQEYLESYTWWQAQDPSAQHFPMLNERVSLVRLSPLRPNVNGTLVGFDPGAICIQVGNEVRRIGLLDLRSMESLSGSRVDAGTLRELVDQGKVPFMSRLLLGTCHEPVHDTVRVPFLHLSQIWKQNSKHATWTWLAIGAAGDVIMLAIWPTSRRHILGSRW